MWTELVLLVESATGLCLSLLNVLMLLPWIRTARLRSRRIAALVLACVCAGLAAEAALFLLQRGPSSVTGIWAGVALVTVRSILTASAALVSVLLLRASLRHWG